jgi:cardiolipin synthase
LSETLTEDEAADAALQRHEARHAPLSDCPVLPGNGVTLIGSGGDALAAMFDAIEAARDHVHLEYYILEDVSAGGRRLSDLLVAACARGVRVAAIYDAVGSHATSDRLIDRLEKAGVQTLEFRPLNPLRRHFAWHLNDRDHRKILVVDGRLAFLGGVNLSVVYQNPPAAGVTGDPKTSFWHDCAVRIEGPAVEWAQRVFLDTWQRHGGDALSARSLFPPPRAAGAVKIRIAASAPLERRQLYFRALHEAVDAARHRILLATGYFVPARRDWKILADAARRGVEVDLVLAGASDVPAAMHAARALYGRLLSAGVRIHELQDGLLHAKAATIDGVWSVVGSSNFDRRSYSFNNEVDAVLLGRDMAAQLETLLRGWMARATPVTLQDWRRRSVHERAGEYAARLWERYM